MVDHNSPPAQHHRQNRPPGPPETGPGETTEPEYFTVGRWARVAPRPTVFLPAPESLPALLGEVEPELEPGATLRVMLMGPAPWEGVAGVRVWAGQAVAGWQADQAGHYLDGAQPVLRYRHQDSGARVEVIRAATWFGELDLSPRQAARVWRELGDVLAGKFRGAVLMSTPATTGRDLFLRSLGDHRWPVLSSDLQELIRSTSGQGRIELMAPEADRLGRLVEYDGRMMYAGCVAELPAGDHRYDRGSEFLGYTRARYLVDFTVPARWDRPGLLGVTDDDGGWRWPATPGEQGRCWVDGAELRLAIDHDWSVRILERLWWPERGRPMDLWADRLVKCLDAFAGTDSYPAARAAVRAIVLHGIGALHGRPYRVSRSALDAGDVPAGAQSVTFEQGAGVYTWAEQRPTRWPDLAHPEWTAAIWGRARARLLDAPTGAPGRRAGMLHVAPGSVVAVRTDAIYLRGDPVWPDDGKVGRFTLRGKWATAARWPTSHTELLKLRAELADTSSSTNDTEVIR